MSGPQSYRIRACAAVLRAPGEILTVTGTGGRIELPSSEPHEGEALDRAAARAVTERAGIAVVPTEIAFVAERRADGDRTTLDVCFYANPAGEPIPHDGGVQWVALHDARLRAIVPNVRALENSSRGRYFSVGAKR